MAAAIELESLLLFGKVLDAGGITSVSAATGIPKSTISRKISRLEKAMGVKLLGRDNHRMTPTTVGVKMHSFYKRIASEAALADEYVAGLRRGNQGVLKVLVPSEMGVRWLGRIVSDFIKIYPGIELHLAMVSASNVLADESFDIALHFGRPSNPSLITKRVATFQRGAFASPGYIQAHGAPRTPDELIRHPCILTNLQRVDDVWTFYRRDYCRIVRPDQMIQVNNIHLVRRLILDGIGVGVLTEVFYARDLKAQKLVRVLSDWKLTPLQLVLVTPTRSGVSVPAKSFADLLVHRVRDVSKRS